jgi:threonine/homoserine/homoserine lactone efflux protein
MILMTAFFVAFAFSFVGSIPPGVLNLTVIQLGLEHKLRMAYRFAFAAALVEYPYAWIAVTFEHILTASPAASKTLQLLAAIVLVSVGVFNLWSSSKTATDRQKLLRGRGFRRGLLLGLLNPMALPFWLAVTAYLKNLHWIALNDQTEIHGYLAGVVGGAFAVLITLAHLARYATGLFTKNSLVSRVPGVIMITLGLYGVARFFIERNFGQ